MAHNKSSCDKKRIGVLSLAYDSSLRYPPLRKEKVMGKHPRSNGTLMQDKEHYLGCLGEGLDKKMHGSRTIVMEDNKVEVQKEEGLDREKSEVEATSLGAAGTLTGAEVHACQRP
jgi:hypothetical protein